MNGWQRKTFISLEYGEPISYSHYELLSLEAGNNDRSTKSLTQERGEKKGLHEPLHEGQREQERLSGQGSEV